MLPHFPRGVVRLVGYLIYRTFGWSDRDGRPMREQHQVSNREPIGRAGISRGAPRQAIHEAIRANLAQCVRLGQTARLGWRADSSAFELKRHDGQYTTDPVKFEGFFEGAGHRTYISHQFLTRLLPHEPLRVLKVVAREAYEARPAQALAGGLPLRCWAQSYATGLSKASAPWFAGRVLPPTSWSDSGFNSRGLICGSPT